MNAEHGWIKRITLLLMSVLVIGIMSACSSGGQAATAEQAATPVEAVAAAPVAAEPSAGGIPELVVTKNGDELIVPDMVPAGPVSFVNETGGSADLNRLNDGVTPEQLQQQVAEDVEAAVEMITMYGGSMVPGGQVVYDVQPGNYVVSSSDDEGNVTGLAFLEAGESSDAPLPKADVNVDLVDFAFVMPTEIHSGPQTWQITNKGTQSHMMIIGQLAEGKTMDDVMASMMSEDEPSGPPPFDMVGGWTPMSVGATAWTTMDLAPGDYLVLCPLPDVNGDFAPHMAHGMVAQFTVTP